jgi:hypothetical protein
VTAAGLLGGDELEVPELELEEVGREVLRPDELFDGGQLGAVVEASEPVVVSTGYSFPDGRAWLVAVPVAGTTVVIDPIEGAPEPDTTVPSSPPTTAAP